jgi:hypothetical protein
MSDHRMTRGELAQWVHNNPEWYSGDPGECYLCGRDAVPVSFSGVFIPTPDGSVCLHFNKPSCLSCRVDAAEELNRRGRNQTGLEEFEVSAE